MTTTNPRDYWYEQERAAKITYDMARARLEVAPRLGQMSLLADERPPALAERRGEVLSTQVCGRRVQL